ncbi:BMP family ABC transporter substrate-binding protein [Virgibacillus byunsanensis]|uniref:BMP family ABC transporter substrate-binding protein n=1 Tax=Virgibacillus byunsanensis TaxID=570945 RepID=A0ABW3LJU8_9BACI
MPTLKKTVAILLFVSAIIVIFLSSCSHYFNQGEIQKVGMLVENPIHEQAWTKRGYEGLLDISEKFDVEVYYKEGIQSDQEIANAVDEFVNDGVNLIFGHSNTYGKTFMDISQFYPDVHFVYFNGGYFSDNVTSLNFNAHAMGFFGGMVAGEMTNTNEVGLIAAYEWQPEVEGFYEGVKYQNPSANVHMDFIRDWNDQDTALDVYDDMRRDTVDVFYPAGDAFSQQVIQRANEDSAYAIGFVTDQSHIDQSTVLTSTIQHVDKLYTLTAERFDNNELKGSILTFDFQDEVISLGEYSSEVPESFQRVLDDSIETYIETELLPNELENNR